MENMDIINVIREGLWTLMLVAAPIMITGLVVGLSVSLIQALTQIQETTLTFVPKVVSMIVVLIMALPYMLQTLEQYGASLFDRIANIQ